jgi:hypothetical protein
VAVILSVVCTDHECADPDGAAIKIYECVKYVRVTQSGLKFDSSMLAG